MCSRRERERERERSRPVLPGTSSAGWLHACMLSTPVSAPRQRPPAAGGRVRTRRPRGEKALGFKRKKKSTPLSNNDPDQRRFLPSCAAAAFLLRIITQSSRRPTPRPQPQEYEIQHLLIFKGPAGKSRGGSDAGVCIGTRPGDSDIPTTAAFRVCSLLSKF
jgi:hypothetical protein